MALPTKGNATPLPGVVNNGPAPPIADTTVAASVLPGAPEIEASSVMVQSIAGTATATGEQGTALIQAIQERGFSQLDDEIRYGSFPSIKLDKDKFFLGDGGEKVDEFTGQVLTMRYKWIFKAMKGTDRASEQMFFSYDHEVKTANGSSIVNVNAVDTAGNSVQQKLAAWRADGLTLAETRKYMEAAVKMQDTSFAGTICLLNIPPVSVARIAGYRRQTLALQKKELDQVLTKFCKGNMITTKNKDTFYPWDFKFVGIVQEEVPDEVE